MVTDRENEIFAILDGGEIKDPVEKKDEENQNNKEGAKEGNDKQSTDSKSGEGDKEEKGTEDKHSELLAKGIIDNDGDPGPNHQRFKKIYGDLKKSERLITEQGETLKEIQEENKRLRDSVSRVEDSHMDASRPDPETDPTGYDRWVVDKAEKRILKRMEENAPEKKKTEEPASKATDGMNDDFKLQVMTMAAAHVDYDDMTRITMSDMEKDVVLRAEIYNSDNPAKASYEHGVARTKRMKAQKTENNNNSFVEGSSSPPSSGSGDIDLTPTQKNIARKQGITEKEYKKNLMIINKERGVA